VRNRTTLFTAGVVFTSIAWSGCRTGPPPQDFFDQAETLRLKYEKKASQQAIDHYQRAIAAWKRSGDSESASRAAQQLGVTYEQLGLLQNSLASYETALSLARESTSPIVKSEILSDLGIAQSLVADRTETFEDAERHCLAALDLARRAVSERAMAKAINCRGETWYLRRRSELALEFYAEAGRLWDKLDDRRGQAQTMLFQGYVYSDLSRFDQARTCYERARALWSGLGDKREQAITAVAQARLHVRLGDYQKALFNFEEAQTLLEPMGDVVWEGASLTGMARVYQDMGQTASALKHWERALQHFESAGLKNISADILSSLGETYLASGDDANALSRFERALALAEEQGIQHGKAKALRFIGTVYLFRHQSKEARSYFDRSLEVQRSPGGQADPRLEAQTRADVGEAFGIIGEDLVAASHFENALALSKKAGDRVTEARGLFGLARSSRNLNHLAAARKYVERSLNVAESLRTEVESRDLRASYMASVYQYHELRMDVLMGLHGVRPRGGFAAEAFEASEQARARSLLDSLAGAGIDLRAGVEPALLKREQKLKREFEEWATRQRRVVGEGGQDRALRAIEEEYRDLEDRYDLVQAEMRRRNPNYAAVAKPQPLHLATLQREALDEQTVLLEYGLGERRSFLWMVSNTTYASYVLPPRSEIESVAARVHELLIARLPPKGDQADRSLQAPQENVDYWTQAARLSEMLLRPVAKEMAGKRVLVVADGVLQYIPFAALPIPGKADHPVPMLVEHEIVSLPSASVLAVLRRQTKNRSVPEKLAAVFADPVFEADDPRLSGTGRLNAQPSTIAAANGQAEINTALRDAGFMRNGKSAVPRLVSTRQEAAAIAAAAPLGATWKAIDFEASRATAMRPDLAQYRIVHFATHGVFNNEHPGSSGIILSMFNRGGEPQDGFLRLRDIYNLHLPSELVVLSSCDTALGRLVKGEGLVGLVRGFMYAGAKRVVASLWKVDDEATEELMGRFYDEMLRGNRTPAAALRKAQLAMWQEPRWQQPFYWAAFVLQGEWK
jgi:CHAT domain-containing protein/tetratricopeptide (TPR) repeat protein